MKTKHTPGPWSVTDGIYIDADKPAEQEGGEDMVNVVELRHGRTINQAQQEANARLIAAAPDLLAALKNLITDAEDRGETRDGAGNLHDDFKWAYEAIAKAEDNE